MEATKDNHNIYIKLKTWISNNNVLSMYIVTSWIFYFIFLLGYYLLFDFSHNDILININGYCLSIVFLMVFSIATTTKLKDLSSWPYRWSIIFTFLLLLVVFFESFFLGIYSDKTITGYIFTSICVLATAILGFYLFKNSMGEGERKINKLAGEAEKLDTANVNYIAEAAKELGGDTNG